MDTPPKDVTYRARPGEHAVIVEDHRTRHIGILPNHGNHSPDGHSWGYGGSGPAQLAKDILWDHLGEAPHPACYQDFKEDMVASVPMNAPFRRTSEEVDGWLVSWRAQNPNTPYRAIDFPEEAEA